MTLLQEDDPVALVPAVRGGDLAALERLLAESRGLASARIGRPGKSRTLLHVATDWPGYFPDGPAVTRMLLCAGADPDVRTEGGAAPETPLHWTASSDDVDVAEVLIDGGADIEAPGGSIGTPLGNAVGYGCWHVARALVERGARVDALWQAAALGMLSRVEELTASSPPPGQEEITEAFWQACHGGQRRAADYLLRRGADINGIRRAVAGSCRTAGRPTPGWRRAGLSPAGCPRHRNALAAFHRCLAVGPACWSRAGGAPAEHR